MQVSQHLQVRNKLMGTTLPAYMESLMQSADNAEIQQATTTMFNQAAEAVFPGKRVVIEDKIEPV